MFRQWENNMKDKKEKNNFSIKGNEFSGGLKSIAALAAVAYLLYIFTFYIDGEMGMILIAFMIFAPAISFIMAIYARDRIKISFNCDAYVKKHSTLKVTVTAEKTGFFPLAVVEVKLKASEVFEENDKIYRFSMVGEDKKTFTLEYKAQTGGNGEISVENIYSCGFLGFLKFKVPATKTYTFTFSKQTEPDGQYNNGYAYIKRIRTNSYNGKQYLDSLKFKTQGGKTSSAYFNSKASGTTSSVTTGSFIPKRSCKVKLKKGETVYLYLYFAHKGSIRLNIK